MAAPSKVTALLAAPLVKSTVLATPDLYASSVSEKRKLRFGIQGPDGRRSRVWTLSAKATGSDVFLIPCDAPCNLHISLHNERYWHIQMEDEEGKHPSPLGVVPEPILAGKVTRAFLVAISPGGLTGFPEPPDPRVKWCPPATSPGNWAHFDLFFEAPGVAGSWRMTGAKFIGSVPRGDGGSVFVTWREGPLDTANLEAPAEMFESQRNEANAGKTAAMLVLPNDHGSWRVVEGPVERTGPYGFSVVCDRPWWPESETAA